MQVVYIEDNPSNVLLMQRIFGLRPHLELSVATSGAVGLDLVRTTQPALVLLDLRLPDMQGSDILHELKQDAVTAPIPVVIISGDRIESEAAARQLADAAEIITKPFDLAGLLECVDRWCLDGQSRPGDAEPADPAPLSSHPVGSAAEQDP